MGTNTNTNKSSFKIRTQQTNGRRPPRRLSRVTHRCLRNGRQFMCTHETNHPSSGQLLLSTRAITHLQLNNVSREYFAYVMTRIPDFLPFPTSFWHGRGVLLLINQVSRHESQTTKAIAKWVTHRKSPQRNS